MFVTLLCCQNLSTNRHYKNLASTQNCFCLQDILPWWQTYTHTQTQGEKNTSRQAILVWQSRMCWEFSPFSLFIAHLAPHFTNHVVFDENKSVNLLFLTLIELIDGDIMIALPNVERKFWRVFKSSRHMDLRHTEMSLQTVFTHPADTDQHYHPIGEVLLASI